MPLFERQNYVYKLCVASTVLMTITTLFHIVYIVNRPLLLEQHEKNELSMTTSSPQADNATISQPSTTTADLLRDAYQQISYVFDRKYLVALNNQNRSDVLCPPVPPDLRGPMVLKGLPRYFSLYNLSSYHSEVQPGGQYHPTSCVARHKVAIIVPYRNRWEILEQFLFHTHNFLQRQQLDYRVYVCEQAFDKTFNKGIVMNGCFKEILKLEPDTPCFIMHDVDLLLIDDRNMYSCPSRPRHLSVAIDKFQFYLPYQELVGGVLAMRREHYILVNGYSTNYWGWGGEDDDMYKRIVKKHLALDRPPAAIARYKMLKHVHQKLNPARMRVLGTANSRIDSDGVNNVKYKLLNISSFHLFTHFLIDVGEQPLR